MKSLSVLISTLAITFLTIPSFANITVSPGTIMFGAVSMGQSRFRTAIVNNFGPTSVNVQVSGFCPSDIFVSNGCYTLNPHQSCSINVNYHPTRPGHSNCNFTIRDSSGGFSSLFISGQGIK